MTTYRRGTGADTRTCYEIFEVTVDDLGQRTGSVANSTAGDPNAFELRRPLFDHLAETADEWWMATDEGSGRAVGYARSILRDGVRELTEFFVLPEMQAGGVGRELLARAFPSEGARHRAIVATTDARAIARYLRTGLGARLPLVGWEGVPRDARLDTDLVREPIDGEDPPLEALATIDRHILGFRRDEEHRWLAGQRSGWLYRRQDAVVGYAYHPTKPLWGGPYAALEATDLPVLIADAEAAAAAAGHTTVTFDLALTARPAIDHLLGRGFRVDPFMMLFFSDGPVELFDRYVLTSPPFFA
jgi:GNAT superfamily N-acetyltransferase